MTEFDMKFIGFMPHIKIVGVPGGSVVKNLPANAGEADSIPWSGRSPGEGNGNPLQYSWLGNPMDTGAWRASPWSWKVGPNLMSEQ